MVRDAVQICGILSGAFRISCITVPAFSTRSCSFFWAAMGNARTDANPRHIHILLMIPPLVRAESGKNTPTRASLKLPVGLPVTWVPGPTWTISAFTGIMMKAERSLRLAKVMPLGGVAI